MTVGGNPVLSGATNEYLANTPLALDETLVSGYTFVSLTGDEICPEVLGGTVTLAPGDDVTCTITNNDIAPKLHLRKVVVNDNGGTKTLADFTLTANGTDSNDLSGTSPVDSGAGLKADTWALSETSPAGYSASAWVCVGGTQEGANITVGIGGEATCTITNDDIAPKLTIVKVVNNAGGGTATVADFGITTTAPGVVPFGAGVTVGSITTYTAGPSIPSPARGPSLRRICPTTQKARGRARTKTAVPTTLAPSLWALLTTSHAPSRTCSPSSPS